MPGSKGRMVQPASRSLPSMWRLRVRYSEFAGEGVDMALPAIHQCNGIAYLVEFAVKSLAAVEHGEKPLGQADAPAWVYILLPTDVTALKPVPGFSRCGHQIVTIWLRQATSDKATV